jgi:hypothetical protein
MGRFQTKGIACDNYIHAAVCVTGRAALKLNGSFVYKQPMLQRKYVYLVKKVKLSYFIKSALHHESAWEVAV